MGVALRCIFIALCCCYLSATQAGPLLRMPPGFYVEHFSYDVPGARSLTLGKRGTLFVGTRGEGKVYALQDLDGDQIADKRFVLAEGLNMPNGVAFLEGDLYVAEVHRILRYDNIEARLTNPPAPLVIYDQLPTEHHHGWRYLAVGPDRRLYIAVGAPCNVCLKPDYAQIISMRTDGSERRIEAQGVRNSVGFVWHPSSHELWFTDNGRDWLGDDSPPDELNRLSRRGEHFGFPYCHGATVSDPKFGQQRGCAEFTPPALELGAHVAALGLQFYSGKQFPDEYQHNLFIAEHGSWNRSSRVGYRLSRIVFKDNQPVRYQGFIEGWLSAGSVYGRPVDVLQMPDGALLVSDDYAGVIYRIRYDGEKD